MLPHKRSSYVMQLWAPSLTDCHTKYTQMSIILITFSEPRPCDTLKPQF